MFKIKKKKGYTMVEDLKKHVYGFCRNMQKTQIWCDPDRDKSLPEDRLQMNRAIFNVWMTLWTSAIALGMPIRKLLIEYEPAFADSMPIPSFMNTPKYREVKEDGQKVNVIKGKLWGLPYGFYLDNIQGLWLWIDSENMSKRDILEALTELMESGETLARSIRDIMAAKFPEYRKMVAESGMFQEDEAYGRCSDEEFQMIVQLRRESPGFCWGGDSQYPEILFPDLDDKKELFQTLWDMWKTASLVVCVIQRALVDLEPESRRNVPPAEVQIETTIESKPRWNVQNGFYYSSKEGLYVWSTSANVETLSVMEIAADKVATTIRDWLFDRVPEVKKIAPEGTKYVAFKMPEGIF